MLSHIFKISMVLELEEEWEQESGGRGLKRSRERQKVRVGRRERGEEKKRIEI